MAKVVMKSVTVAALRSERKKIMELLQRQGVIDISRSSEEPLEDGFFRMETDSQANSFERSVAIADQALSVLNEYAPQKKGLLSSLSGRREITDAQYKACVKNSMDIMDKCRDIVDNSRRISELLAERIRINAQIATLEPWRKLDVSQQFAGTLKTSAFIGVLPGAWDENGLCEALAEKTLESLFSCEIISSSNEQTCVFVLCLSEDKEAMAQGLRELGFVRPPQATTSRPIDKIASLNEKLEQLDEREQELTLAIKNAAKYRDDIEIVADYLTARAEKYRAIGTLDHTKNTFIIKGYIPEKNADRLKQVIERDYTAAVEISDAGDDAPTALENNSFTAPAAGLTELYSLPSKDDLDPTPIMSFFYYFFFGMMLSDAGYGLLLWLGSWLLIKKCRPEKAMERNLRLFMYCGVFTVIWGVIFGSFFGDIIWVVSDVYFGKTLPPWPINPMNDATQLFIVSLALGFVMIVTGLFAKFYNTWRKGAIAEAVLETGSWLVILFGIAVLAVGIFTSISVLNTVGIVLAVLGAVMIIANAVRVKGPVGLITGIGGLYDVTGYISDLMSFSRLMALGLTTAAMGQVFNMLGAMGGRSVVGALVMFVIFTVGHLLSFALNALGAYVHTLRLQYVELFGKFYEGGGKKFKPFAHNSKYTRFKEDKKS